MFATLAQRMAAMRKPVQLTTFCLHSRRDVQSMVVHFAELSASCVHPSNASAQRKRAELESVERFTCVDYDFAAVESGS